MELPIIKLIKLTSLRRVLDQGERAVLEEVLHSVVRNQLPIEKQPHDLLCVRPESFHPTKFYTNTSSSVCKVSFKCRSSRESDDWNTSSMANFHYLRDFFHRCRHKNEGRRFLWIGRVGRSFRTNMSFDPA